MGERVLVPGLVPYSATKGAVKMFTQGLSREVGGRGITVNTVQPGPTDTDLNPAAGEWATGKVCTVSWRTIRKWNDSRVVLEHHYDHQQSGEPLSDGDLRSNVLEPPTGFHMSS